jgi:hypothetical protein
MQQIYLRPVITSKEVSNGRGVDRGKWSPSPRLMLLSQGMTMIVAKQSLNLHLM